MLAQRGRVPRAKVVRVDIRAFNESGMFIRKIAEAKVDSFAEDSDIVGGGDVNVLEVAAIHMPGVEASWTEGEGETTFIWDLKDEDGKRVFPGLYVIEVFQEDRFGHHHKFSRILRIVENGKKAA